jgi:hypothetical protein
MKHWLEQIVQFLASGLELLTALIITYASVLALIHYFTDAFSKSRALKLSYR